MIRRLRIAHTSDVHLHNGHDGAHVRAAFARVVDAVLATRAELFLIAGDLFDDNLVHRSVVEFVYGQLARLACPTVIIAGNHDCWDSTSVLRRMDFGKAGAHVTLLDAPEGTHLELPELHATLWGRCMVDHCPEYRPMAGSPRRTRDLWHIGMAHGLYSDDPECDRSSLITPQEIAGSGFDYLALGHVHAHRQMRHGATLACYPGVPAPYYAGDAHACIALVDLEPGKRARVAAYPLRETHAAG